MGVAGQQPAAEAPQSSGRFPTDGPKTQQPHAPALQADTVHDYLLQGLQQSRDTILPAVHYHRRFKPFVQDLLPGIIAARQGLLAHPGDFPPCPATLQGDTVLVIGPEGGFIPYEVAQLQAAGCRTVSLGPRILRVENAVCSLLGRWQ